MQKIRATSSGLQQDRQRGVNDVPSPSCGGSNDLRVNGQKRDDEGVEERGKVQMDQMLCDHMDGRLLSMQPHVPICYSTIVRYGAKGRFNTNISTCPLVFLPISLYTPPAALSHWPFSLSRAATAIWPIPCWLIPHLFVARLGILLPGSLPSQPAPRA